MNAFKKIIAAMLTVICLLSLTGCSLGGKKEVEDFSRNENKKQTTEEKEDTKDKEDKEDKNNKDQKDALVVRLNDYLICSYSGYEGHGSVEILLDYNSLINDHNTLLTKNELPKAYQGMTAQEAAISIFENEKPYTFTYTESNTLSNGDQVQITWTVNDSAVKQLSAVLDCHIEYADTAITVNGLNQIGQVDPFEKYQFAYTGISGCVKVSEKDFYNQVTLPDGSTHSFHIKVDGPSEGLSNGDTIRYVLADDITDEEYATRYGFIPSKRFLEITISGFEYYPAEAPQDFITYLSEESLKQIDEAVAEKYQNYENVTITRVGTMVICSDREDLYDEGYIAQFYHIDDGFCPGGWYTFMLTNKTPIIKKINGEKSVFYNYDGFPTESEYYKTDRYSAWASESSHFNYEGFLYEGCQDLNDCVMGMLQRELGFGVDENGKLIPNNFNRIITSESLDIYTML